MPPEDVTNQQTDPGTTDIVEPSEQTSTPEPPQPKPPQPKPPQPKPPQGRQPNVLTMPTSAMAKIKQQERERGRKLAFAELNAKARTMGYESWEALTQAADRQRQRAQQREQSQQRTVERSEPPREPSTELHPRTAKRLEREVERFQAKLMEANRARVAAEKRAKVAERRVSALEAEMHLRTAAVRAGVRDVDYALTLLQRELRSKDPEALKSFDENAYFAKEMREAYPYLYGVEELPANTGSPAEPKGSPKAPAAPPPPPAGNGSSRDARQLPMADYKKLLEQRGLSDPSTGL